jgi:hypothetical protein
MKAITRTAVFPAAAVVAASLLALAGVWLLAVLVAAEEEYPTGMRIDLDGRDNGPNTMGSNDFCIELKNPGDTFEIDVVLDMIPPGRTVGAFEYSLVFDATRLEITAQNHDMLLGFAEGSVIVDGSEAVPDTTSPHMVSVSDYTAPEADLINGLLGRYTVEVLADAPSGLTAIDLDAPALLDGEGAAIRIKELWSGIIGIGTPCPTPVPLDSTPIATRTPMPSPTITPTLAPTLPPTLAPPPTPTYALTAAPPLTPTLEPTLAPTVAPILEPTIMPTPSPMPTGTPSPSPEATPTPVAIPRALPPTGMGQTSGGGLSGASYGLLALGGVAILAGLLTLARRCPRRTG